MTRDELAREARQGDTLRYCPVIGAMVTDARVLRLRLPDAVYIKRLNQGDSLQHERPMSML